MTPEEFPRAAGPALPVLAAFVALGSAFALCGCRHEAPVPQPLELRRASLAILKDVLENTPHPVRDSTMTPDAVEEARRAQYQIHAQALEVLAEFPEIVQSQWLTRALDSPADAVKYGALLTVGQLADYKGGQLVRTAERRVRELLADKNEYLRLAASFALYKLNGSTEALAMIPPLLDPERTRNPSLRSEAVMVLSLMPGLNPGRLLGEVAAHDPDPSVMSRALMRLAILGDARALDGVIKIARGSLYTEEFLDALWTLGDVPDATLQRASIDALDVLRNLYRNEVFIELRESAARSLGMHGDPMGLADCLQWLDYAPGKHKETGPQTPDPLKEWRVRFRAALALGAIGDYDAAAGPLLKVLTESPSRRFRLTAARAGLELLRRSGRWDQGEGTAPVPLTPAGPPGP
ncbi:MAG: hypothetical protein BIFFINMI_02227 [Phycisphaerae bacterium]|nr:hypothetical protein [Phycisphaerae bacterium]